MWEPRVNVVTGSVITMIARHTSATKIGGLKRRKIITHRFWRIYTTFTCHTGKFAGRERERERKTTREVLFPLR